MLSGQDAEKIRKLKDDLDHAQDDFTTANREAAAAKGRLKQARAATRRAARTRFTRWLTNSDPEEYRRYRQAKEEHKDQTQFVRQLEPRIAEKDERITEAVEECLNRSSRDYQRLVAQRTAATEDREFCKEARTMAAQARGHVEKALSQAQRSRGRRTDEARRATDRTATEVAEKMSATKKRLTALGPRLRAYSSFPTRQIQRLSTEFSDSGADFPSRRRELTTARTALSTLESSLASASKRIAEHASGFEKKRVALVQRTRTQVLGS